jgi:hypothetical protein
MSLPMRGWFRLQIFIFAIALSLQAIWVLAPVFAGPTAPTFPNGLERALAAAAHRDEAVGSAKIGVVRGDLWAESALTYANLFWSESRTDPEVDPKTIEEARDVIGRALAYAPHDARVWLILSGIESRFDRLNSKAAASLRMSYYTGPNELELIPLRLLVLMRLHAPVDSELEEFARRDIRAIASRAPQLKSAILDAYRNAPPEGKQLIETAIGELDPNLLEAIRNDNQPR